ncbi:hypothetical protein CPB83DRAFT_908009 [Crepidotus variabilis]|uniref:Mitochondrial outer membrane transport complex Sam37/metaxin N-terminal domain-containing protein n=1 Tax=Crepidotus variabilis TaxID=179855 RepID=A0A9P6JNN8_9AGAR|nr:hypothetical protein CPB83DRAFT_908009 [Crepidotus variabilis]
MADILPAEGIVLHIWSGLWDLSSFEPHSMAAVLYLQLAIPGKFRVAETSNPDTSPSGQLPYLVHEQHVVSTLPSIIKYVSDLRNADHTQYPNANLDANLTPSQKAQASAWAAHAESHLGDLVAHALYSVDDNWTKMTGPALASMYPIPQKYYVPRRIRTSYHLKLDAAGLWNALVEEKPEDKPFQKEKIHATQDIKSNPKVTGAFEKQKVVEKVRTELNLYQELLGTKTFLFREHPTSLDVIIAAHFILLLEPPYPDSLVKDLLAESYPSLAEYARRVHDLAFATGKPAIQPISPSFSLGLLLPSWPNRSATTRKPLDPEDIQFNRMRWAFFGLAAGAFATYIAIVFKDVEIKIVRAEQLEAPLKDSDGSESASL